jgi:hypothetical protein
MATRPASSISLAMVASLALAACGSGVEYESARTPQVTPEPHAYPQAAYDYFAEVALGSEYGASSAVIRKWSQDLNIAIHGDPTPEDHQTLKDVVADLNALIGTVEVTVGGPNANVDVYFVPEDRFADVQPEYIPVNLGFFYVWWDETGGITQAEILISTTEITQEERNHLIREELTQAMGLMRDSYTYEDSMFYQAWTRTQEYSDLDEAIIEMLYLPEVESGMDATEATSAIRNR